MFSIARKVTNSSVRGLTRKTVRGLRSYDSPNRIVSVIPGDGIGPEITTSAIGVLQASGAPIDFDMLDQRTYRENILAGEVIARYHVR